MPCHPQVRGEVDLCADHRQDLGRGRADIGTLGVSGGGWNGRLIGCSTAIRQGSTCDTLKLFDRCGVGGGSGFSAERSSASSEEGRSFRSSEVVCFAEGADVGRDDAVANVATPCKLFVAHACGGVPSSRSEKQGSAA